jgi:starvation-inducible DNA-binding protein
MKKTAYPLDIGISESDREQIAKGLSKLLADSYTLLIKTHKYHWNVTGPMFNTLHLMFETQYTELFAAVDLVAERIRSLGFTAPGSYSEFSEMSAVKDSRDNPKATDMVKDLVLSHETVAKTARAIFPAAEKAADEATCDLLTQRIQLHEKTAWMLRSLLEE